MPSIHHEASTDRWSPRVWTDSPADLAARPAWEMQTPRGNFVARERIAAAPGPVIFTIVAVTCVLLGLTVSWRGEVSEASAGFWPPAGAALAALLMVPVRKWGWVLVGVAVPTMVGIVSGMASVVPGLWWMVGNTVEPLFSASVMLWFARSRWLTQVRLFVVCIATGVVIGPMVGGAIGATGTVIGYDEPWLDAWFHWVITDGLGVLIVTPLVITLTPHRPMHRFRSRYELVALVLLIAALSGLSFADIGHDGAELLPYFMLAGLVWAGIRFGTRAVAMSGFAIALAANVAIAGDFGPFAESSSATDALTLPVFLMIALSTAFMVALMASELADRDEVQGLLAHRATHDDLTGLPNRMLFADRLDQALEGIGDGGRGVAVLLIDLDDFKKINDHHGHLLGDAVLREVADRLRHALPPGDVLARFGGDKFVAMIACRGGVLEADRVARTVSAALDPTIDVEAGDRYTMSCSIGVALAAAAGPGTATELLRCADIALNQARQTGVEISFYDEVLEAQARRRVEIAQEFHGALDRGEISVVYQAMVSLYSGRVKEFEALARWDNRRFGAVAPDEFVVVAERSGLIGAFGDFVMYTACRQLVEWRRYPGASELRVAVNVSARQLCDLTFPDRVADILATTSLPAHALTLEITETAIMDDLEVTAQVLHQLRALGFRLAMDDFGTGYSSMTNLRLVELDTLKIDRTFINGLGDVAHDTAIVRSIINLGHSFGLTVVAEGVETEQQAHDLIALGCDHGQGYLWSKPVVPAHARQLLDRVFPLPGDDGRRPLPVSPYVPGA